MSKIIWEGEEGPKLRGYAVSCLARPLMGGKVNGERMSFPLCGSLRLGDFARGSPVVVSLAVRLHHVCDLSQRREGARRR